MLSSEEEEDGFEEEFGTKRRRFTKSEALYGAFSELSDAKGSADSNLSAKPVAFVTSSLNKTENINENKRVSTISSANEVKPSKSFRLDKSVKEIRFAKASTLEKSEEAKQNGTESVDKNKQKTSSKVIKKLKRKGFAEFESTGTGFGSKYLEKFGFQGRLGKQKKGIVDPISVVVRPRNLGIGFGDFTEASQLPQNIRLEKQRKGEVEHSDEEDFEDTFEKFTPYKGEDGLDDVLQSMWKQARGEETASVAVKSARDILAGGESGYAKRPNIVDTTRRKAKIVTNRRHLKTDSSEDESVSSSSSEEEEPREKHEDMKKLLRSGEKFGRELVHNVKTMADIAEADLRKAQRKSKEVKDKGDTLKKRIDNLQDVLNATSKSIVEKSELLKELQNLVDLSEKLDEQKPKESTKSLIVEPLKKILHVYTDYTHSFVHHNFICALAYGCTSFWVLSRRQHKIEIGWVAELEEILGMWSALCVSSHDKSKLQRVIISAVQLPLEQKLMQSWDVGNAESSDLDAAVLALLRLLRGGIYDTSDTAQHIHDNIITPKLVNFVQTWNHLNRNTTLHQILKPWLNLVDKSAQGRLHREVRIRLEKLVINGPIQRNFKDEDGIYVYQMIVPWVNVLSVESFGKLVDRAIMPKLLNLMGEMEINPNKQEMRVITLVFKFAKIIQPSRIVALFLSKFFPKWLRVLHKWLSVSNNRESVITAYEWYKEWKTNLECSVLNQERLIWNQFDTALYWLEQTIEGYPLKEAMPLDASYVDVLKQITSAPRPSKPPSPIPDQLKTSSNRELRQIVQTIAEELGFMFIRNKKNKHVDGNLVYELDNKELYFKDNVVFVRKGNVGASTWTPVELRSLFSTNKSAME